MRARSVQIDGAGRREIITKGDQRPVVVMRGAEPVFALTPLSERYSVPAGTGPAQLLAVRHEVVPFVGQEEARRETADWLADDRMRAVRLVTAPGGQGTTRFAMQVAREAARAGWQVLIARFPRDGALLPAAPDPRLVPVPAEPAGVLVVIDGADSMDRLDAVDRLDARVPKIRVLLLARSPEFWPKATLDLDGEWTHRPLEKLPVPVRREMFEAAVAAFAGEARVDAADVAVPDLSAEPFCSPLTVQVAALVAVLRCQERAGADLVADPASSSAELLVREARRWSELSVPDRTMARAVLVATLTGGLPEEEAADVVRRLDLGADPRTVIDCYARCYPAAGQDRVLEPVFPAPLGEDFVAALLTGADDGTTPLADPSAAAIVERLLQLVGSPGAPGHVPVLTVLVEAAYRWNHVAEHLRTWIEQKPALLVDCGVPVFARAASIPVLAPILPRIGALLGDRIGTQDAPLEPELSAIIVNVQRAVQDYSAENVSRLAQSLDQLTDDLAESGLCVQALETAQAAVTSYRRLVSMNRDDFLSGLASSLRQLATHLAKAERRTEAADAAQEAADCYRELAGRQRDIYLPDLAASVHEFANRLVDIRSRAAALRAVQEAVGYYRELTRLDRESYLFPFGVALHNLASRLAAVDRRTEAVGIVQEAVDCFRELAGQDRATHLSSLAQSMRAQSFVLAGSGRSADALDAAREMVVLCRELVAFNRARYLPDLAQALNDLAARLTEIGDHDAAREAAAEAARYTAARSPAPGAPPRGAG